MKKEIKLIAAAFIGAIVLTGCGNAKDPSGYYELSKVTEGSKTVDESSLYDYGLDDAYAVLDDDTGYFVFFGVPRTFTAYPKEGKMEILQGGDVYYTFTDKELTVSDSKMSLTFKKVEAEIPEYPDVKFDKDAARQFKDMILIDGEE